MSKRADAYARERAIAMAKMRRAGSTNKEIARLYLIDPERIPALVRLGETLLTITEPPCPN